MKVSIIVPVYNSSKHLRKCLDSLVNQEYANIEIILVNDGSTDNSLDIIKEYQKRHANIFVFSITNHGQGYARNLGIRKSHSDYIMFVDSDDYVSTHIVSKLINNIGDSDVAVCDMYEVENNKETYYVNYHEFGTNRINFMLSNPGPVAKLYKRSILNNVSFLENVYYEDLAFTPVVSLNIQKVTYVKEALYYYVKHMDSTMRKREYNPKMDTIFDVMDYLNDKLINHKEEYQYLLIEHLLYSATLRYIDYLDCKKILIKINDIFKKEVNWRNNKYYSLKSEKFKIICNLAYYRMYFIIKLIKKVSGK